MAAKLTGKCIWVTRPAEQAENLANALSQAGAMVVRFPVMSIQPLTGCSKVLDLARQIQNYDMLVFVSRNAVNVMFQHYLDAVKLPDTIRIFAIGESTAFALEQYGISAIRSSGPVADSETLLRLPELQQINNLKVLLVRGKGGRDLIKQTLQQRGAEVEIIELYVRGLAEHDENESHRLWQQTAPDAIIVTSNESIENLVTLTPAADKASLFAKPLVVMSKRNAEYARQSGFTNTLSVAQRMNDAGLFEAVAELFGE